jgi:hypothetical protein
MWHRGSRADAKSEHHAGEQNGRSKPRREGRGLGPFTSGHLTVIVVTLLILVAFPFAAFAVTGNNVFITDPTSGNRANVANGKLKVDTGIGTFFGVVPVAPVAHEIYPTNDIIHTVNANLDLVAADDCPSATCQTLLKPPAGKAAVVTSIHIDTGRAAVTGGGESLQVFRSSNGTCSIASGDRTIEYFNPGGVGETVLPYDVPGGLPVPAGTALCVFNADTTNLAFEVSAWGYAVASTAVPAIAAAPTGAALLKPKQP